MGHIIMLASSFARSLSEDAGERSGFALTKDDLMQHLAQGNIFRDALMNKDRLLRIGSEDYADAVGDLL